MSDNEGEPVENPDPESDIGSDAAADVNAAPEAEADSQRDEAALNFVAQQVENNVEPDIQADNGLNVTNAVDGGLDTVENASSDVHACGSSACHAESCLAEGDQNQTYNNVSVDNSPCADHRAEGDQHQFAVDAGNSANETEDNIDNVSQACKHLNDLAAEDEQYVTPNNGVDFSGAEWSLEPEENSQLLHQSVSNTGDGAEGGNIEIEEVESDTNQHYSADASSRTESSAQLASWNPEGCGAEAFDENVGVESYGVESEISEAEGASAIVGDHAKQCEAEAEAEQGVAQQGIPRAPANMTSSRSINAVHNEREESINEANLIVSVRRPSLATNMPPELQPDCHVQSHVVEQCGNAVPQISGSSEDIMQQSPEHVPEDELSVLDCAEAKVICTAESYQPECDQSSESSSSTNSSPSHINPNVSKSDSDIGSDSAAVDSQISSSNVSNSATQSHGHHQSSEILASGLSAIPSNDKNSFSKETFSEISQRVENGAIPKNSNLTSASEQSKYNSNMGSKSSGSHSSGVGGADILVDSEDELLSELDATLTGNCSRGHTVSAASSRVPQSDSDSDLSSQDVRSNLGSGDQSCDQSCDQCLQNKVRCSWRTTGSGGSGGVGDSQALKKRLHQTQEHLVNRECDISRLKTELREVRERLSSLSQEKEACQRELECRTQENSGDLYLPQIKELEYTIAQQQSEIRGFKDKLSSHDAAAKRAIAALQQEMRARVDQLMKRCEEATKEKDTMVVKFAQAEHKNLECQKQAERAEGKLRDMEKERDVFMTRMKAIKDQRTKLAADCEAKASEISQLNREMDKQREIISSADVRVKWAQNKLKAELDAHKDTKIQLEKMTAKLKEAKEETQQIRQDCQAIIRTYQESEEVKSNSLDKELKLKQTELLQNQMQKNNFELAHVKTQRELAQVRGEYDQSRAECRQLKEQISALEGEREEMKRSISSYTEIIQRQKKEIQELRERVETLVQYKTDFIGAQELIKTLDGEIAELKINNKDLVADMDACRRRETEKLDLTEKLSLKNAELQSENTTLSNKVMNLQGELQALKMEYQDTETRLNNLSDSLAEEQKLRLNETRELTTKLAGKCKAVEDLTRKVDEEKDEIRTLKRKHTNNVKDLTRQLQQARRKLENYETNSNGDKDTVSMGSRTSSNGSLNTIPMSEHAGNQLSQPNGGAGSGSMANAHTHRNPSPEQEYPVIVEQVEVDKQVLIERIVKLQRILAKRNEKIEFMDDHISQLIDEIQKKNRIIQSYVLKEETGTMTSEHRDQSKMEIARKHSIMGSVYSSHSNDGTMTLDLSLEINKKLQAVLEDTLLKNMTLKESLDTLGQEIARLSQENRRLQLNQQQQQQQQGTSRSRGNPSTR